MHVTATKLNLGLAVRDGFLEGVNPKLKLQGEAGSRQVMMEKGKVQRELHRPRLRGKSERDAFRKCKLEFTSRECSEERGVSRDRPGELSNRWVLVGQEFRLHPGDRGSHAGCEGRCNTSVVWNQLPAYPLDHEGAGGEARRPSEGAAAAARLEMSGSGEKGSAFGSSIGGRRTGLDGGILSQTNSSC